MVCKRQDYVGLGHIAWSQSQSEYRVKFTYALAWSWFYTWLECATTCSICFGTCVYYNAAFAAYAILPATAWVTGPASAVSAVVTYALTHGANNGTLVVSLLTLVGAISLAGFPVGRAWACNQAGIATSNDGVATGYDGSCANAYGLTTSTHVECWGWVWLGIWGQWWQGVWPWLWWAQWCCLAGV